jgi:amino-acid N-acetyltransferase
VTAIADARDEDMARILDLLERCDLPRVGVAKNASGFVVARSSEKIVGCCGLEVYDRGCLLRSLAVAPESRARGLGRTLVEAVLERAATVDLDAVYLLTVTASGFFSRLGFAACSRADAPPEIRESWEFSAGCPTTATLMRRALATSSPSR